jgi:predicted nucleotidyltransferase
MQSVNIQDIVKKLNPIMVKYGIIKAYIFGSALTEHFNENSDIDLMFERGKNFIYTFENAEHFKDEVQEALDLPVSIVFGDHFGKAGSRAFYDEVSKTRKEIYVA